MGRASVSQGPVSAPTPSDHGEHLPKVAAAIALHEAQDALERQPSPPGAVDWEGNPPGSRLGDGGTVVGRAGVIAPRAQRVFRVGKHYSLIMPYDLEVRALYKGRLPSTQALPYLSNRIGDMWLVGSVPWIWIVAPGASRADWIDP
jgi:hypothetical protein